MKKTLLAILTITAIFAAAHAAPAGKATIAVAKVSATTAIVQAMQANGTTSAMNRVVESIDANLTAAIQGTRKFEVVSRSDIDAVIKEQDFANSGNVDTADKNAAKTGMLKGAKYIITVAVDDFQDYIEKDRFATLGKIVENRKIRFGAVAKIIDTTKGSIIETANFVISNDGIADNDTSTAITGGSSTDALIAILARNMCMQIANRVADVIFPAKIIAKTGKIATFNRGDGTGVNVGDEYAIFALGEEMVDPDTGEKLGAEEVEVGKLRVISITPKFSKGTILEDNGVDKGQILRIKAKVAPAAPATKPEI